MSKFIYRTIEKIALFLLIVGSVIVLVQAAWITYGVLKRYVFGDPDRMVTEATALMLMPVAFLGLAYALRNDAYPKVTLFIDKVPASFQHIIVRINFLIMTGIGGFLFASSVKATLKNIQSGAASEILLWPKVIFWIPVSLSLLVFTLYALLLLIKPSEQKGG